MAASRRGGTIAVLSNDRRTDMSAAPSTLARHAAVTVVVEGELDMSTIPQVEAAVRRAGREGADVRLDLSAVTFCDCAGLKGLARCTTPAAPSGTDVTVARRSPAVDRVATLVAVATAPSGA